MVIGFNLVVLLGVVLVRVVVVLRVVDGNTGFLIVEGLYSKIKTE